MAEASRAHAQSHSKIHSELQAHAAQLFAGPLLDRAIERVDCALVLITFISRGVISFPIILGPDGRQLVRQELTRPSVYLDTWAIRLFAEDEPALGTRFREALMRAAGTLTLSHLSLSEFTFDDPRHAQAAGRYVDSLIPNLYFSQFDPFKVIDAEFRIMVGQTHESPAGDADMLELYARAAAERGHPSLMEWFQWMHTDRLTIVAHRDAMANALLEGFTGLRRRFDTEPGFAKSALRDIKNTERPRATQALLRALFYRLHRDPKLTLTVNDALDIGHCIVPASYCSYVLVDRAWYTRMQDAAAFLRRCGINTRIAERFTHRGGGVLQFLQALEDWPRDGAPSAKAAH